MWLSLVEEANQSWFSIEPLTLLHAYSTIQKRAQLLQVITYEAS